MKVLLLNSKSHPNLLEDYRVMKEEDKVNQKIAIPTNEGMLWPHFGKAPQVTIVTVEDGQIKESVIKQSPEHKHGAMPRFLAAEGCTDVVCGGLGQGAVGAVLVGIFIFHEPTTFWRLFFLTTLIGSIIGLKALS